MAKDKSKTKSKGSKKSLSQPVEVEKETPDELIADRVSLKQCTHAVEVLHRHQSKKAAEDAEKELLPSSSDNIAIWVTVSLKQMPANVKLKPVKIPIPHPIVDPRTAPICLLTKDPQREYKDLLEANEIRFVSRVIGLEKLKGKFKPYEARRALLKENAEGLFLADERIIPLLPKLLGAKWFDAKKQPIPVNLQRKDLKGELERAIASTSMKPNRGTATSVKIAVLSQKPSHIVENLKAALPSIAKHVYKGWENIQSLGLKTSTSANLPIWSCALDDQEGGRWAGLTVEEGDEEEDDISDVEMEDKTLDKVTPKGESKGKGKKRAAEAEDNSQALSTPRKRTKGAASTQEPSEKSSELVTKTPSAKASKTPDTPTVVAKASSALKQPKTSKKGVAAPAPAPPPPTPATPALSKTADASNTPTKSKKSKAKPPTIAEDDEAIKSGASIAAALNIDAEAATKTTKSKKVKVLPTSAQEVPKKLKVVEAVTEETSKKTVTFATPEPRAKKVGGLEKKKAKLVGSAAGKKSVKDSVLGRKKGRA